ncbi:MAG: tetratricopeptide repeat protein [Pseudomonadota bacterium]
MTRRHLAPSIARWLASLGLIVAFGLSASQPALAADFSTQRDVKEAFIRKLARDIKKIDKSISVTKDLIARSKSERYLPDLVFRLAELYVEKSRLVYFKILEEAGLDDKRSITAPEARLLKDAAIREYRRVLREFASYPDNDKITFFIAHELRELGQYEEMIKTYLLLVEKYPKSDYRFEAWLIVGDYYFDKSDLDTAEGYYKKVLGEKESYVHPMARFKLGWCYLNREKWKDALGLFEKVVENTLIDEQKSKEIDSHKNLNVKREALTSLVYAYPEVKKPEDATTYFRHLVSSRAEYLLVLEKLARRYSVKQNYIAAGNLYRELLSLSHDVDRNIEYAQRVYDAVQASKKREESDKDVKLLVDAAARYRFSWRAKEEEKDQVYSDFEQLTRDLATRLHVEAQRTSSEKLFERSSHSYKAYLSLFIDSPTRLEMRWNYAESLYESKQYVEAGREFESLARDTDKDDERKKAMNSAINAYFAGIKDEENLNRYQVAMAREGLKALGAAFVSAFPDDPQVPEVKFNVARAYYEQGEYDKSIELFIAFAREYPLHKDALAAANLALDAYNNKEDFEGLAKVARELAQIARLGDDGFKKQLLAMADNAEQQEIDAKTIEAGGNVQEALKDFISGDRKGSEVAAKALYQAFVVARDRRDNKAMIEAGNQILEEYGTSDAAKEVLSSLGEQAIRGTDFVRGAALYEEYGRRFSRDEAAVELLGSAAKIRTYLGDYSGAMADYERLANMGGPDAARAYAEMAAAAEKTGEWRRVALAATPIMADPSYGIEALSRAGAAQYKAGQEADAAGNLMAVVQQIPPGSASGEQIRFGAQAAFYLGEILRSRFDGIQFGKGDDAQVLEQKFGLLAELEGQYVTAIKYGDPEFAIGGLYRLGQAHGEAASFLDNAPAPEGVSAEELAGYRAALKEQADNYRKSSADTIRTCRDKSVQLNAFNRFAKACLTGQPLEPDADHAPSRQEVEIPGAEELRAKIEKNPKDVDSLVGLARAANQAGDYYLAKLVAAKALEANDGSALAHNAMGVADIQLGNYQEAFYALQRAKELDGRNPAIQANLGALYAWVGDLKRARAAYGAAGKPAGPDVAPKARELAAQVGG